MRAAWDWHLPAETEEQQRAVVIFAQELGFDTLVVPAPTDAMVRCGRDLGVRVVAIVTPNPELDYAERHPEHLQRMLPVENAIRDAVRASAPQGYQQLTGRWYATVEEKPLLCFEDPSSREVLRDRVSRALEVADGVSFDGFGFGNRYACHCPRCEEIRRGATATNADLSEAEVVARMSEESLVDICGTLYDHAKSENPEAIVMNHVWPPFRPNLHYGNRLRLDYCSQTISWFYRPSWSLQRVEFEASELARLEDRNVNAFVPFIGLFDDPHLVRSVARISKELEIAKTFGGGHLVFCNLKSLHRYPELQEVVRAALAEFPTV